MNLHTGQILQLSTQDLNNAIPYGIKQCETAGVIYMMLEQTYTGIKVKAGPMKYTYLFLFTYFLTSSV